ncbi:MAG TPA: PhzF family phenazine biosynthesis protein [Acetobacteraceae bacterium]|nr:PhzF family phenazine biosynthesis protein [Acetobacteraceae bacterium]
MQLPYWVVDAFTDRVFAGNPAAVLLPEAPLPDALMQSIAAENNLSETAFAVREDDGWHLRWFTPTVEVDLCGHATLATAFVLARNGYEAPFRFRTRSGILTAGLADGRIILDFPARQYRAIGSPPGLAEAIGAEPKAVLQSADIIAVLADAATVRRLSPNLAALPGGALIVTAAGGENADITSRYFAPRYGIAEDPVTGSLHTQVVPYWADRLGKKHLVCRQASVRGGTLWCEHRGERVLMAGTASLYASGTVNLPGGLPGHAGAG